MENTVTDNKTELSSEALQTVTFFIGSELYGIDIRNVVEIIKHSDITPVPNCPEYIEGVTNLRGRIIPIINLKKRFLLGRDNNGSGEDLIVVVETSDSTAGLIVDRLSKVVDIPYNLIESKLDIKNSKNERFIDGIGNLNDKTVIILNCEELLRPENERNN